MYQTLGITVKRTVMRDFCQYHDIRLYCPTNHYLRGDLEEQILVLDKLEELKNWNGKLT